MSETNIFKVLADSQCRNKRRIVIIMVIIRRRLHG